MGKRVLVIDDHPVYRIGVVASLQRKLVGLDVEEAGHVQQALEVWRSREFDVVTLDLSLPGGDGFSLLRQAKAEGLRGAVLIVSMHDEAGYRELSRAKGAAGFIAKSTGPEALAAAVAVCLQGPSEFVSFPGMPSSSARVPPATPEMFPELSRAERRVLELLGRRLTNREIATRLALSVRTVENHRASICRKLGFRGPHRLLELALSLARERPSAFELESKDSSERPR